MSNGPRFAIAFALIAGLACAHASDTGSRLPGAVAAGDEVAAEVLGEPITVAEIDAAIKERLFAERVGGDAARLFALRSETLDRMIDARLLVADAGRLGVEPREVAEIASGAQAAVTDEEVAAFWREHHDRMGGYTFEQLAPQIRRYLERQRKSEAPGKLRERSGVVVHLAMPRVEVAADGPARGPADARVTIVEFADFQCSFCKRAVATIAEVLGRYPGEVRVVYRHLPIDQLHALARGAAEAAECAHEQGQFWAYHDELFRRSPALGRADLLRYAEDLELDATRFAACVDERRYRARIDADIAAARSLGAKGTPTFVVNGVVLSGARSADELARVIEAELARAPAR